MTGTQPIFKEALPPHPQPEEGAAATGETKSVVGELSAVEGYQPVTHAVVDRRFRDLLQRRRDTGLAVAWKEALLEPPNPLKPTSRTPFKLHVLYALWIVGLGIGGFLWFSFSH